MSRTRTRLELRTAVRQRADIENSQHVTDTEINEYLAGSLAAFHALCVEACEDDFTKIATFSTVSGTTDYSLATYVLEGAFTYYKVRSVHVSSGGLARELDRWTLDEWSAFQSTILSGGLVGGSPAFYRIIGGNIVLMPAPQGVWTVRVYFVPSPVDLSDDTKSFDGRSGWEEWVVLDSAIKCMRKEETDTREMVAEREKVEARVLAQVRRMDQAKPHRVQQTRPREVW